MANQQMKNENMKSAHDEMLNILIITEMQLKP